MRDSNYIIKGIVNDVQSKNPSDSILKLIDKVMLSLQSLIMCGVISNDGLEEVIRECLTLEYDTDTQVMHDGPIKPWFMNLKKEAQLQRWNRYTKHLMMQKGWDPKVVQQLDRDTDQIMDQLFNPRLVNNVYDLRGMVVGDVQSGKTSNYIGVCSKAFDAGYKLIVILAGLHNNLRSQTQARIEEDLLGYRQYSEGHDQNRIGVRIIDSEVLDRTFTTSEELGDFNSYSKKRSPVFNSNDTTILVVKKNVTVLKSLIEYLKKQPITEHIDEKLIINKYPLLVIDDECDQASVNTKCMQKYLQLLENNKIEDVEIDATSINKKIRELLNLFSQSAYIGYTATPYANIFINPEAPYNSDIGRDLFPKDFIISLPTSSTYTGATTFFRNSVYSKNLFKPIEDANQLIEKLPRQKPVVKGINQSLKNAIYDFFIATSIRRQRGSKEHNTMLIHVSHFTENQKEITKLVTEYVDVLCNQIQFNPQCVDEFKNYWEANFSHKSKEILQEKFRDNWEGIRLELIKIAKLNEVKIREINGSSGDVLDYLTASNGVFIAIGGNKLSRGLTLEGLTVSYYLRTSSTYDTLMQMGRWFGYRSKYIDVCRIYTTYKLMESFEVVSEAEEELRNLISEMCANNCRPIEFSLRVQKHPSLKPTSQNKMRGIKSIKYGLSATRSQLIALDPNNFEANYKLSEDFIKTLSEEYLVDERRGSFVFENVDAKKIIRYLEDYSVGNEKVKSNNINPDTWAEYIKKMNEKDELTCWTVSLYSLKGKESRIPKKEFAGYNLNLPRRSGRITEEGIFKMSVVSDSTAEFLDFVDGDINYEAFKNKRIKNTQLRAKRSVQKGVLNIYVLEGINLDTKEHLTFDFNPVTLEISFPFSENGVEVNDYYVNLVEDGQYA